MAAANRVVGLPANRCLVVASIVGRKAPHTVIDSGILGRFPVAS